jgi:hypothetical protein
VFAVLRRVREAARVDGKGWLLEGRGRAGWRRQFSDGVVYSIPDDFVGLKFEDRIEQRSYSFGVKVIRADCSIKLQEVMEDSFASMSRL